MSLLALGGCASQESKSLRIDDAGLFQSLPFDGAPFDILADDIDGDGRPDVALVSHADNYAQIFLQQSPRSFAAGERQSVVGFHPGDIIRAPGDRRRYLVAAEGVDKLLIVEPTQNGGLRQVGAIGEKVPRHVTVFRWPGWGDSLAVSPFGKDYLVLMRNFDSTKGEASERIRVALSEKEHSIRQSEWILPADIDGDGIDELLFASHTTQEVLMLKFPGADGVIKPKVVTKFKTGAPWEVHASDLNGDGAVDLVVPNATKPFVIHVLLNDGHGVFQETTALPFPTSMGLRRFALGKDKDGVNYMLGVGYGAVAIYRFPPVWDGRAPVPMRSVRVAANEGSKDIVFRDMDGDGWLDGIVGRGKGPQGVWIVYGPLWENFEKLSAAQFVLN
ncbi:MAG: VCBS repeat-containing protein [Pseudomonadota bacterium]